MTTSVGMEVAVVEHVVLIDGEPGAYGVAMPDFPGCCAMGDSIPEALENAAAALRDWSRALEEQQKLPELQNRSS